MNALTLEQLIADLPRLGQMSPADRRAAAAVAGALAEADDPLAERFIQRLAESDLAALEQVDPPLVASLLDHFSRRCGRRRQQSGSAGLSAAAVGQIVAAYGALGAECRARFHLLRALAEGETCALAAFADLLATDPPRRPEEVLPAFFPLLNRPKLDAEALFPRLLDALQSPVVAAAVLDLANYLTRRGAVATHPASGRAALLSGLLSSVVERLHILQQQSGKTEIDAGSPPAPDGTTPAPDGTTRLPDRQEAARQVADAVPLCVALCDALALIGDRSVVGKIRPALALAHRRLQTEAAGALARLGQQEGIDTLKRLVVEPVARLRVLAYLDELGLTDEVPQAFRTPVARAEAELACWLSEPTQFGVPPAQMELVDQRRLYWPGFEQPQDCFLFRYTYAGAAARLSGIGIAGPATHAVGCDLEDLPPADIYALYAGWQAQHSEIGLKPAGRLTPEEHRRASQRLHAAAGEEYVVEELVAVGRFFGESLPIATAVRGRQSGVAVLDGNAWHWVPRGHDRGPLGPTEAWWLHVGRNLLKTFNPESETADEPPVSDD